MDGSGGITFDEFVMMMRLGDMQTDFEREIIDAFDFFDKNKDGMVSEKTRCKILGIFRGFLSLCQSQSLFRFTFPKKKRRKNSHEA